MSYFNDGTFNDNKIQIDGVDMPLTSEPVKISINTLSDGDRLADTGEFVGKRITDKVNIELHYAVLNKEHYDRLFNATIGKMRQNNSFFMSIKVPTYTPDGYKTYTGYFMATHNPNCTETTEKIYYSSGDARYNIGGSLYDELHEDVTFSFVQR